MPINLNELRTAVKAYLDTKVTCSVSEVRPEVPTVISPKEKFFFDVSVVNANADAGGIRLKNVRYQISVLNLNFSTLKVPAATVGTCLSTGFSPAILTPGTPASSFILIPAPVDNKTLDPGETDSILNLEGQASQLGPNKICFQILADVDLDYLFPRDETSALTCRSFSVV